MLRSRLKAYFDTLYQAIGASSVDWGDIGGTLSDQTDLAGALDGKQATLVSGTNIKTVNSNTLLGSGNLTIEASSLVGRRDRAVMIEVDFYAGINTTWGGLYGYANQSGTINELGTSADANHIGIVAFGATSSKVNSGYGIGNPTAFMILGGGEKAVFTFKDLRSNSLSTVIHRFGFLAVWNITSVPNDAIYLELTQSYITGYSKKDGTGSSTASYYTTTQGTWYTATIEVSADKNTITFTLYSEAGTQLWQDTITSNIPNGSADTLGFMVISADTGTSSGMTLLELDYLRFEVNRTLTR